jgi:diacylglycerol kinase
VSVRSGSLIRSIRGAWSGLLTAYRQEPNLRFHVAAAWCVLGLACLAGVTAGEGVDLVLLAGLVFVAELVNTAMERLGDVEAGNRFSILVGEAKRVAAAAVLVSAVTALVGGALIFAPRLPAMLRRADGFLRDYPLAAGIYLAALLALSRQALAGRRLAGRSRR